MISMNPANISVGNLGTNPVLKYSIKTGAPKTTEIIKTIHNTCEAVDMREVSGNDEFEKPVSFNVTYEFVIQLQTYAYVMQNPYCYVQIQMPV